MVDASVVVQYAIAQGYTPEARVLVTRMYQGEQSYIPEFCLMECVNVLGKEVRFRGLPQVQAELLEVAEFWCQYYFNQGLSEKFPNDYPSVSSPPLNECS